MSGHLVDAAGTSPRSALAPGRPRLGIRPDVAAAIGMLAMLAFVVAARWAVIRGGVADPISIGVGFGVALLGVATVGRSAPGRRLPALASPSGRGLARSVVIGIAGGGALIALALLGHTIAGAPAVPPPLRGDLFAPWLFATILVAAGEEVVLRGVVFERLLRGAGVWPAVLVTSLAFALMHVPFYGWRVVPLDVGVGVWFAGLRMWSGGVVAPSISHALADLVTWWL